MYPYVKEKEGEGYDILSPYDYMESLKPFYPENQEDSYVEYKSLINLTSLALLKHKAVIFHAAAFKYKGKAWLFTGRSGAGKTTQYRNWKRLYSREIEMICGDMPCLEVNNEGKIDVYPSPWNGKERIKGNVSAPLGGVILLEHGDKDVISLLEPKDALHLLFNQSAVEPQNVEDILNLSYIIDILLRSYPIWKLTNKADMEAVRLCADAMEEIL